MSLFFINFQFTKKKHSSQTFTMIVSELLERAEGTFVLIKNFDSKCLTLSIDYRAWQKGSTTTFCPITLTLIPKFHMVSNSYRSNFRVSAAIFWVFCLSKETPHKNFRVICKKMYSLYVRKMVFIHAN